MRIVIAGGGTAGWLAALIISKIQRHSHEITVIESSRIGIVGAGEGSTGHLTDIVNNVTWDYGCDEAEFMAEARATVKLGIRHRDWRHVGHEYIGPIDSTNSFGVGPDYMFLHALSNDLPWHASSDCGWFIEHGLTNYQRTPKGLDSDIKINAYHFDAHGVGRYFRKVVEADGVAHIDGEIVDVLTDASGITGLLLQDGRRIDADFYIDCTGFARKLMTALDVPWNSYRKHLPVNRAMPFLIPYADGEIPDPTTLAWAQSSGWMWRIPTADRYGCGYVYDGDFISDAEAQAEIEVALGRTIEPIRVLKFDTGCLDQLWHKNCLALGLCAAFAEPLEATSIHSTIVQIQAFTRDYLRDTADETLNPGSRNIYNRRMRKMYEDFRDFLVLHYQSQRDDSEFWRWLGTGETRTDVVSDILSISRSKVLAAGDMLGYHGYAGVPLWNWVLAGLGHLNKHSADRELAFYSTDRELVAWRWNLHMEGMRANSERMVDNGAFLAGR